MVPTEYIVDDGFCVTEEPPLEVCDEGKICEFLKDPKGPYAACHALIDPSFYYESCVRDTCENNLPSLCSSAFMYAEACQRVDLCLAWRDHPIAIEECPVECGGEPDVFWSDCVDPCQKTYCQDDTYEGCEAGGKFVTEPVENKDLISKFLRCPKGQTFDWGSYACVEKCPVYCQHNTQWYKEGDNFNDGCRSCECTSSGEIICAKMVCPTYDAFMCPDNAKPTMVWDESGCCKAPRCPDICVCSKKISKPICDNCQEPVLVGQDGDCCPVYECQCNAEKNAEVPSCVSKYQQLVPNSQCCNRLNCECNCPVLPETMCPFGYDLVEKKDPEDSTCGCKVNSCVKKPNTCIFESDMSDSKQLIKVGEQFTLPLSCTTYTCESASNGKGKSGEAILTNKPVQCNDINKCPKGQIPLFDDCGCIIPNACENKYCVSKAKSDNVLDVQLEPNQTFTDPDTCTTCTCDTDYCLQCTRPECQPLPADCVKHVTRDGECCPTCIQTDTTCSKVKTETLDELHGCQVMNPMNVRQAGTFEMSYCAGSCDSEAYFNADQGKYVSSCGCCNPKKVETREIPVRCNGRFEVKEVEVALACHCKCGEVETLTCDAPTFGELFL